MKLVSLFLTYKIIEISLLIHRRALVYGSVHLIAIIHAADQSPRADTLCIIDLSRSFIIAVRHKSYVIFDVQNSYKYKIHSDDYKK